MNEKFSKLRQEQHQEQVQNQQQQQTEAREFASVEEMLRHDAAQTQVPSGVALKLNQSIANEPKAARPWWRRLFSR